jgi:hypothetical protein
MTDPEKISTRLTISKVRETALAKKNADNA